MSTPERQPTRAEFRKEVLAALAAAGLEGPYERADGGDHLLHAGQGAVDLRETYDNLSAMPAAKRAEALASLVRLLSTQPKVPQAWGEAKSAIRLSVKTRIALAADEVRQARGGKSSSVPRSDLTAHLVLEVVVPLTKADQAVVADDLLAVWGVSRDEAFQIAGQNLARSSGAGWGTIAEAPGVYFSAFRDGFDAARVALPRLFTAVPLRGRPVALAASPSALAFAGDEDEEGLFHLARLVRRLYEQSKQFLFLRPIRLKPDEEGWQDWMPPKGHGAYEGLRLLQAINEVYDYEEHALLVRRAAEGKGTPVALPRLEIVMRAIGGEPMTVTRWKEGPPRALPKADSIVFERDGVVLGIAAWENVVRKLPGALRSLPGYPARFMADDFPEGWRLAMLDLEPWSGPQA